MKIATCQMADIQGNPEEALRQIVARAQAAAAQDVRLLVFPECYLPGYISDDEPLARARSLDLSSPAFAAILRQLGSCRPVLVFGLIEIDQDILYNTAVVVNQGKLIGAYRKTHPNENIYRPGVDYPIFSVEDFTFGINICNDANFPEAAGRLADQGADIIMYPLNNMLQAETAERWRHKHIENLIARAQQTGAWIISADVVGERDGRIGYGCSAIVNPSGALVTRVSEGMAGMAVADI